MSTRREFHGRGARHPMSIDATGGIAESAQLDKIDESIRIILGTQHGERVMRPRFGCNLKSLVFAPNNTATANLARYYVEEGLTQWEPRIELIEVKVVPENREARLVIHVQYTVRASHEVRTLIYPFYLEQR